MAWNARRLPVYRQMKSNLGETGPHSILDALPSLEKVGFEVQKRYPQVASHRLLFANQGGMKVYAYIFFTSSENLNMKIHLFSGPGYRQWSTHIPINQIGNIQPIEPFRFLRDMESGQFYQDYLRMIVRWPFMISGITMRTPLTITKTFMRDFESAVKLINKSKKAILDYIDITNDDQNNNEDLDHMVLRSLVYKNYDETSDTDNGDDESDPEEEITNLRSDDHGKASTGTNPLFEGLPRFREQDQRLLDKINGLNQKEANASEGIEILKKKGRER
ncbi:hypothetical protein K469DRAFT_233215 [Zopfia rhizophila CBS 207.26]|uniref:Uncharacterized protein n=1 Tax=Zopfia rhizophila CBS 207.26 TaxID=1314779 RepID=A0A6A6DW66_9PEZI|nr:hypothetical protein K469DRAFT_233215 [Zopfia rhizophila CBS 207.26]